MLTSFKRVIRIAYRSFFRNSALSVATISVMIMVVFLISVLFLFNLASGIIVSGIKDKVDISVYFKEDVLTENILEVKSDLSEIPEVKEVEYISKEMALEVFIEKHKDDPLLMQSLAEVGSNPFLASVNIRTQEISQYEQIAVYLEQNGDYGHLIEKIDYYQRKPMIEKALAMTSGINRTGIIFSIVLGLIAILVAFNTIRIAIYNSGEEIEVMKLVGASNWFIRGPFLIQGIIIGIIATLVVLLITFGLCYGLDSKIKVIAPSVSTLNLFISNFWILVLTQLIAGIGLGVFSSLIAVRKYLKV